MIFLPHYMWAENERKHEKFHIQTVTQTNTVIFSDSSTASKSETTPSLKSSLQTTASPLLYKGKLLSFHQLLSKFHKNFLNYFSKRILKISP